MESKTSRRYFQSDSNFERAEFISARTDTKQRLGELFIYHPTKLEMFGLRQVSSKIPKFKHTRPLFELQASETSRSLAHATSSISISADCQKCNQSLSKMISNKQHQEQLVLNQPQLVPEEKKKHKLQPQKNLESHQSRSPNELPPILAHPQIQPPPFGIHSTKVEKEHRKRGKLAFGRLAKKFDHQLLQSLTQELEKQWMTTESPIPSQLILLKHLNLKRSKQASLSKAIKEDKKIQYIQEKRIELEMFKQKEREINSIIFSNSKIENCVDDIL